MKWVNVFGVVSALALVTACDVKINEQCKTDSECPEGAWCNIVITHCVQECAKAGCLEGHFCDPNTRECVTDCPYGCTEPPPKNGTRNCNPECSYACNSTYTDDGAGSCYCDASRGVYDAGEICAPCNVAEHCGPNCERDCTLTGQVCNDDSTACVDGPLYYRYAETGKPNEPMVKDNHAGLVWQGCAAELWGEDCTLDESGNPGGTAVMMTWWDATDIDHDGVRDDGYCPGLSWGGHDDWRLPRQTDAITGELSSIVAECPTEPSQGNACIDNEAFPNTPADRFWSSSAFGGSSTIVWDVFFHNGSVNNNNKGLPHYVRCVRGPAR